MPNNHRSDTDGISATRHRYWVYNLNYLLYDYNSSLWFCIVPRCAQANTVTLKLTPCMPWNNNIYITEWIMHKALCKSHLDTQYMQQTLKAVNQILHFQKHSIWSPGCLCRREILTEVLYIKPCMRSITLSVSETDSSS